MAKPDDYLRRLSAYYRSKPKFNATVAALCGASVGLQELYGAMPAAFDLDLAVGVQLDAVGRWVGLDRKVRTPISNVYFSHDIDGLGFDQGVWQGPFDPDSGLTELDDDTYRLLLRAKIGANHWDGTLEASAAILNDIFSSDSEPLAIQANGERFGMGDGSTTDFPLRYQGRQVYQVGEGAVLYRRDWQGNVRLDPSARTNLVRQSAYRLSNWGRSGTAVVTANWGTAPDGSNDSAFLSVSIPGSSYTWPEVCSYVEGTKYTASVWFKVNPAMPSRLVRLTLHQQAFGPAGSRIVLFDVSNGNLVVNQASAPEAYGSIVYPDGWMRVWLTHTATTTVTTYAPLVWMESNIEPGQGIEFWGLQLEAGVSLPTAYIPTAGIPATLMDYTLDPAGIARISVAPVSGAELTWSGSGQIYPPGTHVLMQDNGDMSIDIGITGTPPSALFLALLTGGYIPIKPEGVRISYYVIPSEEGPLFGFDVQNHYISGFDGGLWGSLFSG